MQTTALITGATRGIGRALALRLAQRGLRLFASGRDETLLARLREETGCAGAAFDLADAAQVLALWQAALASLGQVDMLICNAGCNRRKAPLAESTTEEFDEHYAVNLRAPYILGREALRHMAPRRSGQIVNVLSTCALHANENMGIYTAMKAGLRGLTGVLIKEARPHGVKVSAVYPGGTDTEFRAQARPDYLRADSVAAMIEAALFAPADVVVHDLVFRPLVETNF
jgi:NAD(P)-dependent dehydrogenase (short-subunit alcohol dehydrogenase family)